MVFSVFFSLRKQTESTGCERHSPNHLFYFFNFQQFRECYSVATIFWHNCGWFLHLYCSFYAQCDRNNINCTTAQCPNQLHWSITLVFSIFLFALSMKTKSYAEISLARLKKHLFAFLVVRVPLLSLDFIYSLFSSPSVRIFLGFFFNFFVVVVFVLLFVLFAFIKW